VALSMEEVAGLAYDAGLRDPRRIAEAVAIATAESGREPRKLGDQSLQTDVWGPSVGLWQIRSLKADKGTGRTRDADKLVDPASNSKAMVEISKKGADWSPWSVTKLSDPAGRLRYQAALPLAATATAAAMAKRGVSQTAEEAEQVIDQTAGALGQLASTVSDAVQTPARILNWLTEPGTWARIAFFTAGGVAVLLGLALVVKGPMTEVASAVGAGKALKTLKKVK
jgi:Lysozyme like domain